MHLARLHPGARATRTGKRITLAGWLPGLQLRRVAAGSRAHESSSAFMLSERRHFKASNRFQGLRELAAAAARFRSFEIPAGLIILSITWPSSQAARRLIKFKSQIAAARPIIWAAGLKRRDPISASQPTATHSIVGCAKLAPVCVGRPVSGYDFWAPPWPSSSLQPPKSVNQN